MIQDTSRFIRDLSSVVSTLCQDVDMMKLSIRLEEVLSNYEVHRKTAVEVAEDLPENIEMFLSAKRLEGLSEITLYDYSLELRLFHNFTNKATSQITTADIRKYLASNNEVMLSTIGTKTSVLKSLFAWLVDEELILRNPASKIKLPKKPSRIRKGLTVEELELVRESCETKRQRALIEVFYSTGCRLSEVVGMNIADVNAQSMSMSVIGKGDKERIVFLSFKALYHLRSYLGDRTDEGEAMFVNERRPHRRMGTQAIQLEIDKIEKLSDINKPLTPHTMRHTIASIMIDNGADMADVQQILGHEDISTTQIYAQVSEERKKAAFTKYHVQ